jgi:S-adenosylmethionine hydrolase
VVSPRRITLLTDFATADGYVAAMKGVIATIAPGAIIDDASHDIAPGDVAGAAWALDGYWHLYPAGTIHVVVVDPGVGSDRQALAVDAADRVFIAPDNGALSSVLKRVEMTACVALDAVLVARSTVSDTFHGRDIFAPAAALIASGARLGSLGAPTDPSIRSFPHQEPWDPVHGRGAIVHVDRFGNLVTNIPGGAVARAQGDVVIEARSLVFPLRRVYADVPSGERLALVGSRGTIELSVRDGSAATEYQLRCGEEVRITS